MTTGKVETEVLLAFRQIIPPGIKASQVVPNTDFKSELGVDSIGLLSVISILEENLNIDLFIGRPKELAEARTIGDIIKIAVSAGQMTA